jgi:RNA polymerase sigma factor (sigma-70 family)
MRKHSAIALRLARGFEFDAADQADLLQEILVAWWRSISIFPASANARQWLYRVSLDTALTWQRRECRRHRVIDQAAPFAQLIESTAQPADPEDCDAINDLYRAIRQLRPAERALILLHLDGLSYGEIADRGSGEFSNRGARTCDRHLENSATNPNRGARPALASRARAHGDAAPTHLRLDRC